MPHPCAPVSWFQTAGFGAEPAAPSNSSDHRRSPGAAAADVAAPVDAAAVDALALARFVFATLNGLAEAAREGVPVEELESVAAIAAGAWPVSS